MKKYQVIKQVHLLLKRKILQLIFSNISNQLQDRLIKIQEKDFLQIALVINSIFNKKKNRIIIHLQKETKDSNYTLTKKFKCINWRAKNHFDTLFSSVKPTLKKVSKHENKFAKLQKEAAKYNFRNQLKTVKKQEYTLKEEDEGVSRLNRIMF